MSAKQRIIARRGFCGKASTLEKLEKALGTAKYANHAKTEWIGDKDGFAQRQNTLFESTPFPFAYFPYFAV
jgi:hypothetical protein